MSAQPAPEIIMDARGFYWRRYPEHLSMCPTTDDNESVEVATIYLPAEFGTVYWRTLALRLQSDLDAIRESRDEKQRLIGVFMQQRDDAENALRNLREVEST